MTGNDLRTAREAAGLSLYDVTRRMVVSTLRWHRIEQGLDTPTEAELAEFEHHVLSRR